MKCLQCNKMVKNKKFCNDLCETRFLTKGPRNCVICNIYMGLYSADNVKATCSNKCRGILKQTKHQVKHICLQCQTEFYTSKSRSRTLCSPECRQAYTSTPSHIHKRTTNSFNAIIDKYTIHPFKLASTITKSKDTKLKKYGDVNYVNPNLAKKTKLIRYGNENYNNSDELKSTMMIKYGVINFNQTDQFRRAFFDKVVSRMMHEYTPLFSFDDYIGVDAKYPFLCNTCNNTFTASIDNGRFPKCKICNPNSSQEIEIYEYIKSLTDDAIIIQDRTTIAPLELDIVIPNKRIAIEYNGIYWHSELKGKTRQYHLNKTRLCEEGNIKLIHISDNEWDNSKKIIQSILQTQLAPQKNKKVYARKCIIKTLAVDESREFLETNHLQGNAHASIRLGLFHEDELVQVLTFSKSRFSNKYEYEMVRLCSKIQHTIVGGAKKLLAYFIKNFNPSSIVTFADRRFFTGDIYKTLGFVFDSHTLPNYYYFRSVKKLESRLHYQKHKLKKILPIFDENLSEWENMKNNGYDRIWDCGHSKFIWMVL